MREKGRIGIKSGRWEDSKGRLDGFEKWQVIGNWEKYNKAFKKEKSLWGSKDFDYVYNWFKEQVGDLGEVMVPEKAGSVDETQYFVHFGLMSYIKTSKYEEFQKQLENAIKFLKYGIEQIEDKNSVVRQFIRDFEIQLRIKDLKEYIQYVESLQMSEEEFLENIQ